MKYLLLVFCSLVLTASCSDKRSAFQKLVKKIIVVRLPFSHTCGIDKEVMSFSGEDSAIYRFLPEEEYDSQKLEIVGKIVENTTYVALILANVHSDVQLQYLVTFTPDGKLIDQIALQKNGCSNDEDYYSKSEYTIGKDISIKITDSSAEYKRDKSGNVIPASIISQTHCSTYNISSSGLIKKIGL